MKPNVTTNHIMVTVAPVHDHTRHQECEYTNQTPILLTNFVFCINLMTPSPDVLNNGVPSFPSTFLVRI